MKWSFLLPRLLGYMQYRRPEKGYLPQLVQDPKLTVTLIVPKYWDLAQIPCVSSPKALAIIALLWGNESLNRSFHLISYAKRVQPVIVWISQRYVLGCISLPQVRPRSGRRAAGGVQRLLAFLSTMICDSHSKVNCSNSWDICYRRRSGLR